MAPETLGPHVQHHICKVPCFDPAGPCLQSSRPGTKLCQVGRQAGLWRQGAWLQHKPATGGGQVAVTSTGHTGWQGMAAPWSNPHALKTEADDCHQHRTRGPRHGTAAT